MTVLDLCEECHRLHRASPIDVPLTVCRAPPACGRVGRTPYPRSCPAGLRSPSCRFSVAAECMGAPVHAMERTDCEFDPPDALRSLRTPSTFRAVLDS